MHENYMYYVLTMCVISSSAIISEFVILAVSVSAQSSKKPEKKIQAGILL